MKTSLLSRLNSYTASIPLKGLPWAVSACFLLLLPLFFPSGSALTIMNQMAITIIFALAYNMLLGQGGMLSFGHAAYMGLGGFFSIHLINQNFLFPLVLLPLFGALFGLFCGVIIGSFSTRRGGTNFAMISLAVGELIAACSLIFVAFFGGEEGISGDRTTPPAFIGIDFASQQEVYYLTAAWLLIASGVMYLFSRTPLGRLSNAVRDNPERAEFLGYSQHHIRWLTFSASSFFCGLAGALFAINYEILTEENLNIATSGTVLLITFLGGIGFFIGPIIGAIVFTLLQTIASLYTPLWQLYLGLLFVLTVMFFPSGLTGILALHYRPWQLGKLGMVLRAYLSMLLPAFTFFISIIAALEIIYFTRQTVKSQTMHLFGFSFNPSNPLVLTAILSLLFVSFLILKKQMPSFKTIWHKANQQDSSPKKDDQTKAQTP